MKLIEEGAGFRFITVMIQKEVARRLTAPVGSDEYGAITAAISLYGNVKKLFDVSAGNFNPKPKVDSAVVRISLDNPPKYTDDERKKALLLIKAAFGQRRKTLVNSLSSGPCRRFPSRQKRSLPKQYRKPSASRRTFGAKNSRAKNT